MSSFASLFLPGVLLPAAVSLLCFLFLWQPWRRLRGIRREGGALAVLGIGPGYLAGHVAINGPPVLEPVESTQWLFWLVAAATLIGLLETLRALVGRPVLRLLVLRIPLVAALIFLTLRNLLRHSWEAREAVWWSAGLVAGALLLWYSTAGQVRRLPRPAFFLSWSLVSAAAGATLLLSGSARLGQMMGALAAATAAPLLLLFRRAENPVPAGVAAPLVICFAGLMLNGAFFTEASLWSSLLLATSPLIAWLGLLGRPDGERPWRAALLTAAALLLVLVPAVGIAGLEAVQTAEEDPYSY